MFLKGDGVVEAPNGYPPTAPNSLFEEEPKQALYQVGYRQELGCPGLGRQLSSKGISI